MEQHETMDLRLWEYIDGLSSPEERFATERLITEQAAWRIRYHELQDLQTALRATELDAPSLRFTKNVMEGIARLQIAPATRNYINKNIIWGIAAFFIMAIVTGLAYVLSEVHWTTPLSDPESAAGKFSQVDYSRLFSNEYVNGFMMLNVVLGLMLLDRYLAARRKTWKTT